MRTQGTVILMPRFQPVETLEMIEKHRVSFMANNLPSGLYFYRIRFEGREYVRPMVLIR